MRRLPCLVALLSLLFSGNVAALEEPLFEVLESHSEFELRRYASYIVAEVDVTGNRQQTDRSAFQILAAYIFGDNADAEKMSMTAPVTRRAAPHGESLAMTAPVRSMFANAQGASTYAFVMERKYKLHDLPRPRDARIRLREIPARTMAVRQYSGRWSLASDQAQVRKLREALASRQLEPIGEVVLARYNSPFSLPLLRRNEVMLEIRER